MNLMLKATALVFLYGIICPLVPAQLKLTRAEEELRGPVRTVETTHSSVQLDYTKTKYIEAGSAPETASFDPQGRKTEEYSGPPRSDSSNNGKTVVVYDPQGRLQEIVEYDSEGKVESRFTATHDNQGRIATLAGSFRMKPGLFSGNGKPFQIKTSFVYTATGKIIEHIIGDLEEQPWLILFKTVSTFRQDGKLVNEKFYAVVSLESEQTYTYDSKGRLAEMTEINPKRRSSAKEVYTNDERGNPVEIKRYSKGILERRGLVVYEYDSIGNWVKKSGSGWSYSGKRYQQGASKLVPHTVTRRVITYYEAASTLK